MRDLYQHIKDENFATLAFTARANYALQDTQVPVRVLSTVFTKLFTTSLA